MNKMETNRQAIKEAYKAIMKKAFKGNRLHSEDWNEWVDFGDCILRLRVCIKEAGPDIMEQGAKLFKKIEKTIDGDVLNCEIAFKEAGNGYLLTIELEYDGELMTN